MKKIANIYLKLVTVCLCVLTLTACAEDEISGAINVVEGKPVTVSFDFSAAQGKDIVVTRADNRYSTLSSLAIFVYSGDGSIFQHLVTTSNSSLILSRNSTSDADGVRYTVKFETTSGIKKLLAVANTSTTASDGGYWESLRTIAEAAQNGNLTFDELKSSLISLRSSLYTGREMQPIQITSSDQMLISGWNESVVFNTDGSVVNYGTNVGNKDVILRLERSMARITFNIPYKEYVQGRLNKIFTPTSYRVYNVPVKSYLANTGQITDDDFGFVNYTEVNVDPVNEGNYSFSFYMPENVYDVVTGDENGKPISIYHDRDTWYYTNNVGASPEDKIENDLWAFAPQYSTFVVIKGTYEQSGGVDALDKEYTGSVEYVVHLGDFSPTGNVGNYSVERNCSYTYTVKVEDVDRIVVEAEKEDGNYQEGSEGSIYDYTQSNYAYILDAHYEQVYLEYNLSNIAKAVQETEEYKAGNIDQAIADALVLTIQSEAMDYEHTETADEPYSVHNKQGTLKPYQIYVDANGDEALAQQNKSKVLDGHTNKDGKSGFDYKWVEFWPQFRSRYGNAELAKYPGVSDWSRDNVEGFKNQNVYGGEVSEDSERLMDVYDVIVEMGKAVRQICDGDEPNALKSNANDEPTNGEIIVSDIGRGDQHEYVASFTAFVNENYYYRHPLTGEQIKSWSLFTNKMPREMIVAMNTSVSADGNSSYSELYSYISQLSIQTFYNSRKAEALNGFGIETYNETPLYTFGNNSFNGDKSNGRSNQLSLLNMGGYYPPMWNTYITYSNNGWFSSVTSERVAHKLTDNAYSNNSNYRKAAYACMSRNRDLNGNEQIDENEVRWYLASVNEYIRMSIGADAISNAAQLYTGDKNDMSSIQNSPYPYPMNYISDGSLYFTSSASSERVYWAVERGSYGYENDTWTGGERTAKPIRCIRLLPGTNDEHDISTISGINSDATYVAERSGDNVLLRFKDRLVDGLYRERVAALDPHNEDDPANSFYDGIVVSKDYVEGTFPLKQIIHKESEYQHGETWEDPCAGYTEDGYIWRVPNLVEFSAMNAERLLYSGVACGTQFSNDGVRLGFITAEQDNNIYIMATGGGTDETLTSGYKVRCVRDIETE